MVSRRVFCKDGRVSGKIEVRVSYPGREEEVKTLRVFVNEAGGCQLGANWQVEYRPVGVAGGMVQLQAYQRGLGMYEIPKVGWEARISECDFENMRGGSGEV